MDDKPKNCDYEDIARGLANRDCVLFLGAGISAGADGEEGAPSAGQLAKILFERIKDYAQHLSSSDREKLSEVADIYEKKGDKTELDNLIKASFEDINKPLKFHGLISSLPFRTIITTNYDILLEEQFRKDKKKYIPIVTCEDIQRWEEQKIIIFKIHGCVKSSRPLVVSGNDYTRYLIDGEYSLFLNVLKTLFSTKTILFIGYSISDINIKVILEAIKGILPENRRKHYLVYKNESDSTFLAPMSDDKRIAKFNIDGIEFLEKLANKFDDLNSDEKIGKSLNSYLDNFDKYRLAPLTFLQKKILEKFKNDILEGDEISNTTYLFGTELKNIFSQPENQVKLCDIIDEASTDTAFRNIITIIREIDPKDTSKSVFLKLSCKMLDPSSSYNVVRVLLSFLYSIGKLSKKDEKKAKKVHKIKCDIGEWVEKDENL